MTGSQRMPPARRRPIPGMTSAHPATPPPELVVEGSPEPSGRAASNAAGSLDGGVAPPAAAARRPRSRSREQGSPSAEGTGAAQAGGSLRRRPAADYAATRLVNFRIPVDLHDRFRQLVRDTEHAHPRLRHPSLTELVIALLEEGPETVDEVAELIRRKRASEHEER